MRSMYMAVLLVNLCLDGVTRLEARDLSLPTEYEAIGDRGLGLGNMATAGIRGPAAIRINPGMLALDKDYSLSAAYLWDPKGRDYYQFGVVDGTTADFSAGLLYTGFQDSYRAGDFIARRDSPAHKRASLGVAFPVAQMALGLSAHYVEGTLEDGLESEVLKSVALGAGIVAMISSELRFGLSVENFNNRRIENLAPTTYRAGVDWRPFGPDVQLYFDYRRRARVDLIEGPITAPAGFPIDSSQLAGYGSPEQMLFAGGSIRFYDMIRMTTSYGQAFSEDRRQTLSGSISLNQQGFSLAYALARPHLDRSDLINSLSLTMLLQM